VAMPNTRIPVSMRPKGMHWLFHNKIHAVCSSANRCCDDRLSMSMDFSVVETNLPERQVAGHYHVTRIDTAEICFNASWFLVNDTAVLKHVATLTGNSFGERCHIFGGVKLGLTVKAESCSNLEGQASLLDQGSRKT
jgi:hypothetical protein